jgi:O-acetyl-ADP-ribose deacetylase (regulator of RNase III)
MDPGQSIEFWSDWVSEFSVLSPGWTSSPTILLIVVRHAQGLATAGIRELVGWDGDGGADAVPVSVIDGLVRQLGELRLRTELARLRLRCSSKGGSEPCPVGSAVQTSSGSGIAPLSARYDAIVHTTPPFYKHDTDPMENLSRCYQSALQLSFGLDAAEDDISDVATSFATSAATSTEQTVVVAMPLLGSGARGFPYDVAVDVASDAAVQCCSQATATIPPPNAPIPTLLLLGRPKRIRTRRRQRLLLLRHQRQWRHRTISLLLLLLEKWHDGTSLPLLY